MSKNRRVVVLQLVGLGVVVVLGPFRDKITSSQFHLSSVWGLAKASKHRKITTKKKSFMMVIFSFSLLLYDDPEGEGGNQMRTGASTALHPRTPTSTYASWPVSRNFWGFVLWKWNEWAYKNAVKQDRIFSSLTSMQKYTGLTFPLDTKKITKKDSKALKLEVYCSQDKIKDLTEIFLFCPLFFSRTIERKKLNCELHKAIQL